MLMLIRSHRELRLSNKQCRIATQAYWDIIVLWPCLIVVRKVNLKEDGRTGEDNARVDQRPTGEIAEKRRGG